jgi:hypothetical protein
MSGKESGNAAVGSPLLVEAALLSYDTFADTADYGATSERGLLPTGDAPDRGWTPLDLPGLAPDGVQVVPLAELAPEVPFSSAAHFYTGELEGQRTLAIAFRGTDEAEPEFVFQGNLLPNGLRGWDLYQAAHAEAVDAALAHAADPANGIERVLIAGHSLGGIIAELATGRDLLAHFPQLAERTVTVTFGSLGSTETVEGADILNIVHTDDLVARLPDLSPLFQAGNAAREGVTLSVDRPEGTLLDFAPEDLDTQPELLAALANPANRVEHDIRLYIDTARSLAGTEQVEAVLGHTGEPALAAADAFLTELSASLSSDQLF